MLNHAFVQRAADARKHVATLERATLHYGTAASIFIEKMQQTEPPFLLTGWSPEQWIDPSGGGAGGGYHGGRIKVAPQQKRSKRQRYKANCKARRAAAAAAAAVEAAAFNEPLVFGLQRTVHEVVVQLDVCTGAGAGTGAR